MSSDTEQQQVVVALMNEADNTTVGEKTKNELDAVRLKQKKFGGDRAVLIVVPTLIVILIIFLILLVFFIMHRYNYYCEHSTLARCRAFWWFYH